MFILGILENGEYGFYLSEIHGGNIPEKNFFIDDEVYQFLLSHNGEYTINAASLLPNLFMGQVATLKDLTPALVKIVHPYTPPPKTEVDILREQLAATQKQLDKTIAALDDAKSDNLTSLDAIAQIYELLLLTGVVQ